MNNIISYLKWLSIRARNQPKRLVMQVHLWWLKRSGLTIVHIPSDTAQAKKLVDYKSETIHKVGNVARVVMTLAPTQELRAWARDNVSQTEWKIWALEDGSLNFIFNKPEEAFAFKMAWG